MIVNNSVTIYHMSGLEVSTDHELWTRYNYSNVWFFGGKGSKINKGYENAQLMLGMMYYKGEGTAQNYQKAF